MWYGLLEGLRVDHYAGCGLQGLGIRHSSGLSRRLLSASVLGDRQIALLAQVLQHQIDVDYCSRQPTMKPTSSTCLLDNLQGSSPRLNDPSQ